jgi:hypothetical protein
VGSPYTTDLLYHELFLELSQQFENFHYRWAISREPQADGAHGLYVDALLGREPELVRLLSDERTVLYLCGLVGLKFSAFRRLATLGLLDGYASDERGALGPDPAAWAVPEMKRALRATERCMIEVY